MGDFARRIAPKIAPAAKKGLRVLTWDVENTPNIVHTWGLHNVNVGINQIVKPATTFAFAAKWYGEKEVMFHSDHTDGHEAMVLKAHELLSEADIVVGFNSVGFDNKHMAREFLLAGFAPPKPFKNVDLLRVARSQFKFTSNRLDHLAQQLGLGSKTSHQGHELWTRCMAGDERAWKLMSKYNRQDVVLTEKLYDRLRPYIPNHPHMSMLTGQEWGCPNCGHSDVSKNRQGTARANVTQYRQYQCPACGTWIRGNKKLVDPTHTRISR
jgi:predicted RNA-binding Zn-ribbon protein involved in translation (DUF1610 family)